MITKCSHCKREFNIKPSQMKRSKNCFCSKECHDSFRHQKNINELSKKVGEDFEKWLKIKYIDEQLSTSQISKLVYGRVNKTSILNYLRFFDIPIRNRSESVKLQWVDADKRRIEAGKNLLNPEVREKIKETQRTKQYRVKSREAKLGEKNGMYDVLGENHPRWNLSRTDEQRIKERKTHLDGRFRKAVLKRDNRTCQCCGHSYDIMIVHHLDSYTTFPNARYEVENGVTLCEYCHIKYHKTYDATKEQFNLFLSENHLNKV